jgi:hypothetical protein
MSIRFRLAALLPLVLLADCGGAPGPKNAAPAGAGSPLPWHYDGDESATAALLPSAPPGAAPSIRLKGLSAMQVKAALGTPEFRRRDAPAEIWQYRTRACTLDVFLYDETAGQTVAHYAVRTQSGVNDRDCVEELLSRVKGAPTS